MLPGRVKKLVLRLVLTEKIGRKDSIAKTIGLAHLVTIYVQLPEIFSFRSSPQAVQRRAQQVLRGA